MIHLIVPSLIYRISISIHVFLLQEKEMSTSFQINKSLTLMFSFNDYNMYDFIRHTLRSVWLIDWYDGSEEKKRYLTSYLFGENEVR